MTSNRNVFLKLVLLLFSVSCISSIPFEDCGIYTGNCTVISGDGGLGSESANSVWIRNGFLDFGYWGGCPYQNNTCPTGFSYYGWTKFFEYPTPCENYGILVSTPVFNIQLLGNGHLATYAWLPNGTEYYAESPEPILLNQWTPIVVQFKYFSNNGTWRLIVLVQNQLFAGAIFNRNRTYTPPSSKFVFAGNGVNNSRSLSVQLDRIIIDGFVQELPNMYGFLLNIPLRQVQCIWKNGVPTKSLSCYWVEPWPLNWTDAYKNCKTQGFLNSYPYGRLARFPSWNASVWSAVVPKIATYGNGSVFGKQFWIGGGQSLKWLDINMTSSGIVAVVPSGVTSNTSTSTSTSCLQVNTQTSPWSWSESACSTANPYICEMSFDCFLDNPCKNQGACQPINDGYNICKCWPGTYGQFCEKGTIQVNCVNNCPCPNPFVLPQAGNCTFCLSVLQTIVTNISMLELRIKQQLVENGINLEEIESWNCMLRSEYDEKVKNNNGSNGNSDCTKENNSWNANPDSNANNNTNVNNNCPANDNLTSTDCAMSADLYGKILLTASFIQKYIDRLALLNVKLPVDVADIWNDAFDGLSALPLMPCITHIIQSDIYGPLIQDIKNLVANNTNVDQTWSVSYQVDHSSGPGGWFIQVSATNVTVAV